MAEPQCCEGDKICELRRFSLIDTERGAPYFDLYSPRDDPISKHSKRFKPKKRKKDKKPKSRRRKRTRCDGHQQREKERKEKEREEQEKKKKLCPLEDAIDKSERYRAPKPLKWLIQDEQRHKEERTRFYICPKIVVRVPSPTMIIGRGARNRFDSLTATKDTEQKKTKSRSRSKQQQQQKEKEDEEDSGPVVPEKISLTESIMKYPPPPTREELALKIPPSQIIINRKKKEGRRICKHPIDSFDFLYNERYRKYHKKYEIFRASDTDSEIVSSITTSSDDEEIDNIVYEDEEYGEYESEKEDRSKSPEIEPKLALEEKKDIEKVKETKGDEDSLQVVDVEKGHFRESKKLKGELDDESLLTHDDSISPEEEEEYGACVKETCSMSSEECVEDICDGASVKSAFTEVDSEFKIKSPVDSDYAMGQPIISKMVQKFQRDSELDLTKADPPCDKTIMAYSTNKLRTEPACFCFGAKNGTLHQGDEVFPEISRDKQGHANAIAAYAYSFTKPPACWTEQDIDKILEIGDQLYQESASARNIDKRPLKAKEINNVVTLGEHKIQYVIHEPDIAGVTKSEDPKIFDLLKGLILFFGRYRAGILTTLGTSLLIMKRKRNYYVFDPRARDVNLYIDPEGKALLANFYDLQSVMVMLVDRGDITNSPYIISRISLKKVIGKDSEVKDDGDSLDMRKDSQYRILDPQKAVVRGTLCISDKCFAESNHKQVLCVVVTSLFYNHITPSAAWHSKTLDKILLIGNQLYLECIKEMTTYDFTLKNIPAFFTIGPVTVELSIYANQSAGLMFKKNNCCFGDIAKKFFSKHSCAILEINGKYLGIWKQRHFYYLFDPYCRNIEGLKADEGAACVSMNGNLDTLGETLAKNFDNKDGIFKLHAVKLIKLNKDPGFDEIMDRYADSELAVADEIRVGNKMAVQDVKPITIDRTEFALQSAADLSLGPSIVEIASDVSTIDKDIFEKMPKTKPTITKTSKDQKNQKETPKELVYDLDDPNLSDTQIDTIRPDPDKDDDTALNYLKELTKEEMEIEELLALQEGEFDRSTIRDRDDSISCQLFPDEEYGEDGLQRDVQIQKGKDPGLNKMTAEVNTDLLGVSPLPRILLETTDMRAILRSRKRARSLAPCYRKTEQPRPRAPSLAEELIKKTNFITLPDGSQILYGSNNVTDFEPQSYDDASPYVAIMANAMTRKYSIYTWNSELVDYILKCGVALYRTLNVDFAAFYTIEVPQVAIGSVTYHILSELLFDSLLEPIILESALCKLLFPKFGQGVIATKYYSCAVFFKNNMYYMYDCYGSNLVGLGEGPENTGVACLFRFRTLKELVTRFMHNKKQREVVEPTEATRFIISTVKVTTVQPDSPELIQCEHKVLEQQMYNEGEREPKAEGKPKNVIGYKEKSKYYTIQGSHGLENRFEVTGCVKECHFVDICAVLALLCKPLNKWGTRRVDYVYETGRNLFPYIDNTMFADKRCIRNLLIDKYFFDVVVKRIQIQNPAYYTNFLTALKFVLERKHRYILIQYPNCCFFLYKSKCYFHIFDPYGLHTGKNGEKTGYGEKNEFQTNKKKRSKSKTKDKNKEEMIDEERGKACWIRLTNPWDIRKYISQNVPNVDDQFSFFTVNISFMKKAPRCRRLEYKLRAEKLKKEKNAKKKKDKFIKVLHENEDWLEVYPIPWSRITKELACGVLRGTNSHKWINWDIEYPDDLFSLTGSFHQTSKGFSRSSRGKQTIANCIVCTIMVQMYDFSIWNSTVINSILRNGDIYFKQCIENISDENHEVTIDDFKKELTVHPYNVKITYRPIVDGTMFVLNSRQFNLSKALRYFFELHECRHGMIACIREGSKTKFLAFGRVQVGEYYMFDCQTIGPPMFMDKFRSTAYILRCLSLNRLLHVMTLTLRGGDFFIYEIKVLTPGKTEDEEQITKVVDYTAEEE